MANRPISKLDGFKKSFAAGEVIFRQGDVGRDVFILQAGQVSIAQKIGIEERPLAVLEKGDFFGEMALLEEYPERSATAIAVTDVEALCLSGTDFEELVRNKPRVALRMMAKLSERVREANRRLAAAQRRPVASMPPLAANQGMDAGAILHHATSGLVFAVRRGGDTTVGRHDPVTGVTPDVDLSLLDPDRTVSRRHAVIRVDGGDVQISEVNEATNGTFVNGQRLRPFEPRPLRDGDLLQVALVALTLRILPQPE